MNTRLLYNNDQKRKEIPLWQLLCFVMFCVWQMGFIYFVGPALNIDGRTPLPISADNLTLLIVAAYICSIISMITLPQAIIWLSRLSTMIALSTAIGLFFSLSTAALTVLIYIHCFVCCYMIGFESFTIVNYFTPNSVVKHLLIAYPIGYILIGFMQSSFLLLTFSIFRILTVLMLCMLLIFYFKMPSGNEMDYVKKSDDLLVPTKFLGGFLLLAFLSALLGVIAPAAAATVENGIFTTYIACAIVSLILYLLSKKTGKHPICFISYIICISAVGYILMVISSYVPALGIIATALIGVGMASCALLPLFCLLLFRQYPSRFLVPGYIGLAMLAVIVQSVLVEVFRDSATLLNLAYLAIVVILAFVFISVEPFLIYSMQKKFEEYIPGKPAEDITIASDIKTNTTFTSDSIFDKLTKRETEIMNLIIMGHSNGNIAKILCISEHTVKDHTKNIYRKLEVHSRFELTALVNRMNLK